MDRVVEVQYITNISRYKKEKEAVYYKRYLRRLKNIVKDKKANKKLNVGQLAKLYNEIHNIEDYIKHLSLGKKTPRYE